MDGTVAPLDEICDLAEKYNALVMIDDSHASGFIGENGKLTIIEVKPPAVCEITGIPLDDA